MTRHLTITLSPHTVQSLNREDMALYLFAAVRHGPFASGAPGTAGGAPLVWLRRTRLLQTTTLTFEDALNIYLSSTDIEPNAVVVVGAQVDTALGQTALLNDGRQLTATVSGLPDTAALINRDDQAWTWGLCRTIADQMAPFCVFPLHGHAMGMLAPTDRILALFATDSTPPGAIVQTAFGPGLLIDFVATAKREIAFNIDTGWRSDGSVWATPVPAGSALGPLLIAR